MIRLCNDNFYVTSCYCLCQPLHLYHFVLEFRILLVSGPVVKVRRSPTKRKTVVSCPPPPPPPLKTNGCSHFRLQFSDQYVYKSPFEVSSVIFATSPPPFPQRMFCVLLCHCEILRWPLWKTRQGLWMLKLRYQVCSCPKIPCVTLNCYCHNSS